MCCPWSRRRDIDKIRQTNELADRQTFAAAVNTILNAAHIYIIGVRSSGAVGEFFGPFTTAICLIMSALSTTPGWAISLSASSGSRRRMSSLASASPVLDLDDEGSPILPGRRREGHCADGADPRGRAAMCWWPRAMVSLVDSLVAPLSLINALIVATAQRREGGALPYLCRVGADLGINMKSTSEQSMKSQSARFDCVVIGGGAAGCLLPSQPRRAASVWRCWSPMSGWAKKLGITGKGRCNVNKSLHAGALQQIPGAAAF